MAFDIKTARPIQASGKVKFDISTARPISIPSTKKSGLPLREFAIAGAPGFAMSPGSEDILPMAGQLMGGESGPLSVAGAGVGELARQGIKALRGDTSGFKDPMMLGLGSIGLPRAVPSVGKEVITTGITEGFLRGLGRVARPAANRLMLSVMNPGREVIKRKPNLGVEAVEAGIYGTKRGMLNKAENIVRESEKQILPLLKNRPQLVSTINVADEIEKIKAPFLNVGDDASVQAIDEVKNAILKKGGIKKGGKLGFISLEEANQLKRDLYKVLKSSQYGKGVGEIPVKATARKQAAYGLRKEIEGAVPEIAPINKRQSIGIEAREALENRIANESRNVILPKLAGMGAGGVALSGNIPGGIGILLGDRAIDLLRSAPIITGFSKNLLRAKKIGKPLTLAAAEMARRISNG